MTIPGFRTSPTAVNSARAGTLSAMLPDIKSIVAFGEAVGLFRRLGIVPFGGFADARVSGKVLDCGSDDSQAVGSDGSTAPDVHLAPQTDDEVPTLSAGGSRLRGAQRTLASNGGGACWPVSADRRSSRRPVYSVFEVI